MVAANKSSNWINRRISLLEKRQRKDYSETRQIQLDRFRGEIKRRREAVASFENDVKEREKIDPDWVATPKAKIAYLKAKRAGKPIPQPPPQLTFSQAKVDEFYSSWEWKRVRYDALKKYGRKCMCCGATPTSGAIMNVDHIRPVRYNWELRLNRDNLQILCGDCNMGKGSRDQTDFRLDR